MRRIIVSASRGVEYDLRNDFFAHLERLPVSFFQQNRTGDLMSRATNDLSSVRMMIGPAVMYLANTIITAVVSLFLMFSLDVRLTLIVLLPLPIVSITVRMFGTAIHKTFEEVQEKLSDMSAIAQESLTGVRVVRAYRQEEPEIDRFRRVEPRVPPSQSPAQPAAGRVLFRRCPVSRRQRAAGAMAWEP
jgi:ATP-binding cassette subfamily B protein